MLEKFHKALQPISLLEIVPKEVLQSLMQGFFFGFHAGIVFMYDEGKDTDGNHAVRRLDPVDRSGDRSVEQDWREKTDNFNPFCAKFRENPKNDALCKECDIRNARRVLTGGVSESPRYLCHMGLYDMSFPIKVGNEIRGVIIAGQKIVAGDQSQFAIIRKYIVEKALDIQAELEKLLTEKDAVIHEKSKVDTFEQRFIKFAESMQVVVNSFSASRRIDAEKEALLIIREEVGRTLADNSVSWTKSLESLFKELEIFVGNKPVWLLQRRGSRFQCVASSPAGKDAIQEEFSGNLIDRNAPRKTLEIPQSKRLWFALKERFGVREDEITLIRSDVLQVRPM